jgi:hypothetical protein
MFGTWRRRDCRQALFFDIAGKCGGLWSQRHHRWGYRPTHLWSLVPSNACPLPGNQAVKIAKTTVIYRGFAGERASRYYMCVDRCAKNRKNTRFS